MKVITSVKVPYKAEGNPRSICEVLKDGIPGLRKIQPRECLIFKPYGPSLRKVVKSVACFTYLLSNWLLMRLKIKANKKIPPAWDAGGIPRADYQVLHLLSYSGEGLPHPWPEGGVPHPWLGVPHLVVPPARNGVPPERPWDQWKCIMGWRWGQPPLPGVDLTNKLKLLPSPSFGCGRQKFEERKIILEEILN